MTITGKIVWTDLTIPDAEKVRDFYKAVVGWKSEDVSMGDYADFNMIPQGSTEPVTGICHAQGFNAGLPAQWLIYIQVADLDDSIKQCTELGGAVIAGPKAMGETTRYCVIRDPAGAVCALMQM